jgi:SpoIID/LytB domain protein
MRRGLHSRRSRRSRKIVRIMKKTLLISPLSVPALLAFEALPAYADSGVVITVTGHGWGHGYGAGQYGQAGYAILGQQSYQWILGHYYGGTNIATVPDQLVSVELQGNAFNNITVFSPVNYAIAGISVPGGYLTQLVLGSNGQYNAEVSTTAVSGCGSSPGWNVVASNLSPASSVITPGVGTSISAMTQENWNDSLQLCYPNGNVEHVYGYIEGITYYTGQYPLQRTVNVLPVESYLQGVVASETPASWGTYGAPGPQGEPWGFQALEAQAVESRSFALSNPMGWFGFADTCDSTECQVYSGMWNPNSPSAPLYQLADQAIQDTAGQVMEWPNGQIAETQFSASTGGYTNNGQFPAVVDQYDNICIPQLCNKFNTWTQTLTSSQIEAQFPSIGNLTQLVVDSRNGYGDMGGRVTAISIVGTNGSVEVSGATFASDLGLNSDWFELSGPVSISNDLSAPVSGSGYWVTAANGAVLPFGSATSYGSMAGHPLNQPIVGMASTPDGKGYWLVASDGGVFSFGDAAFYGSMGGHPLNKPIVGMASTPDGKGYWLVASDGGIFSFGDAAFYGSMGGHPLNQPIVGMASTPDGKGYWLVASDGGIFSFGDATFYGSMGGHPLNKPVVGMVATGDGKGYWLVAADGGIFTFGDASFVGSLPALGITTPAVGVAPTPDGKGYYILLNNGQIVCFGDAVFEGDPYSSASTPVQSPIVGLTAD